MTFARFESGPGRRFVGYDGLIDSPIPIPGAVADGGAAGAPADLIIRALPPVKLAEAPIYEWSGDSLLFSAPGIATYRCRPDEVVIAPNLDTDLAEVTALLIATALPATIWMSGGFVLHASAVRLPGHERAIAFAARSGGGKSTLAAELVARGAALVADDSLRIERSLDSAIASGLPGGWFASAGGAAQRTFHDAPPDRSLRRCRLGAVVILADYGPEDGPSRIEPLRAVEQLLANRHRPRVPALLGNEVDTLRFCSFLVEAVPIYVWWRRHGPAVLDDRRADMLMRCVAG